MVDVKTEQLLEDMGLEELVSGCLDLSPETLDRLEAVWNDPDVPEDFKLLLSDLYLSKMATHIDPDTLERTIKRCRPDAPHQLRSGTIDLNPETCDPEVVEGLEELLHDEGPPL